MGQRQHIEPVMMEMTKHYNCWLDMKLIFHMKIIKAAVQSTGLVLTEIGSVSG